MQFLIIFFHQIFLEYFLIFHICLIYLLLLNELILIQFRLWLFLLDEITENLHNSNSPQKKFFEFIVRITFVFCCVPFYRSQLIFLGGKSSQGCVLLPNTTIKSHWKVVIDKQLPALALTRITIVSNLLVLKFLFTNLISPDPLFPRPTSKKV